jgi:hypothetical protein
MIVHLTDLEGRWEKLVQACEGCAHLRLEGDRLDLAPGAHLVFGGDAIDRGPAGRRLLSTLLAARRRYGERVVLLAGNRDINKLRLHRELRGHPLARAPEEVRRDRPALLRWIFSHTMGAREAFGHRAEELRLSGLPSHDEAVVESYLEDVAPGGLLASWLSEARLAHRVGRTLFVHGAVTAHSLGAVPGQPRVEGVDAWVEALNAFHARQLAAFAEQRIEGGVPAWAPIVAYQAPIPGTAANQASVVYGRLADGHNDPRLPEPAVIEALQSAGIDRLVVGHTPVGDVPALLRHDGFTVLLADNSYSRLEWGVRAELDDDGLSWTGRCQLDDGGALTLSTRVDDDDRSVGRVTAEGRLVKGRVEGGWLLFRALPERRVEQLVVEDPGPLGPPLPWDPPPPA